MAAQYSTRRAGHQPTVAVACGPSNLGWAAGVFSCKEGRMKARRDAVLVAAALLACAAAVVSAQEQEPSGLPLHGEEAEQFLRTAEVVKRKALGKGVTRSDQLTLSDGTRTHKAVWKTINEFRRGLTSFQGAGVMMDYEDSYRFEIAAYELDKLLAFDLVPPTVERTIKGRKGALQLWIEGAQSEGDRKKLKISPPDIDAWNVQIHRLRLMHQLTFNWDAQNIENTLFDRSFRVYAVDFSRSFAGYYQVRREQLLERFSRRDVEAIKCLDEPKLKTAIGPWVSAPQIRAVLKRRDQILDIVAQRVAQKGEAAVFLP
jgi:hypothetical protein